MARGGRSPGRRSRLITWISGAAALAMIATIAVVAAGYDARETPREEPAVWAMRGSGQYARVNTLTGEIDTVRRVDDPSGVLQSGSRGAVLSHGDGRIWGIDPTMPRDLIEDGGSAQPEGEAETAASAPSGEAAASRTPEGTRDTLASGDAVLFRTADGDVFLSRFGEGAERGLSDPVLLDPLADVETEAEDQEPGGTSEENPGFSSSAVALDEQGRALLFSAETRELRWYDIERERFTRSEKAPEGVPGEGVQLAIVDGRWVLFDAESGRLWWEGAERPVEFDAGAGALLQASSTDGAEALVADGSGLWGVTAQRAERLEEADGVPVQPIELAGVRYAAWLGQNGARLWSSAEGAAPLELDGAVDMPGQPDPVFRSNGTSALLSEQVTGMMWTLPEGRLIPVEQWSLVDPPKERSGAVVVDDVTEQEPPVAVSDEFGVRAGEPAPLPVLLNDFDPNRKDVLTIVSEGLAADLPESFGTVSMITDAQSLVVQPSPDAKGTATFSYRVTDGVLTSEPATVTLTVVGDDTNTAPQWCPVQGCQRAWPSPELAPGGTLVLPILEGWVDPDGDPMMLESAEPANPGDPVRALVTADGRLALRHTDPNAPDSDVAVRVTVADSRGERTERELSVQIRSNAQAEMAAIAATAQVNAPLAVRPLSRIVGGSGSYALVDASVQTGSATAAVNAGAGTIEVTAKEPGVTVIALTARDTGTEAEISGTLRVTAVEARPKLGLPPLRAFVRPLADTTVDVLDAVPGANGRALVVRAANVVDGELRADVIEHARVRVSGSTPDGAPGRIGAADVSVAEGVDTAVGRLTVFQVPDTGSVGAIAVADAATVRAGAVADIPVLENDVAPPGQRLVLHPEVGGSGAKGELAFASGNTLRYLAPTEPGTYTLSYTTYSASSPEASDVGQVRVTVLPRDGNRAPQPRTLTVRLAPGERATAQVPLSGVDPDGDRVRLTGVSASDDAQVSATLSPRSSAVQVEASKKAEPGLRMMQYAVRDEFGGTAEGRLRVIVTEADPAGGAPITYSDYVRLAKGADEPAVVRPLDNDIDPANGELELLEVVPNVPGGRESPQYRALLERLDTSELDQGRVAVRGGDDLGTVSYRYTVRSSKSTSTADGLIVVQVSARVGQQAPTVMDTVLSARDRAELERGGVDVVTDRVYWAAGDARSLQMTVWGSAADRFSSRGNRIVGEYRAEGDLVPFKLSGVDLTGQEVESFGFLVVPPLDELRLTLKPGLAPIRVDEGKSVDVALADVVDLAAGDEAEFKVGAFPTQRAQASCSAKDATGLSYAAGKEPPWVDTCVVSVKLTEQRAWTHLALPVEIVPNSPVAELETLTRTVAPGASETINLLDMVRWQGGREGKPGDLRFSVSGGGGSFEVVPSGQQLSVTARADAVPGGQDALVVTVSGAGESQAPLTLRVGEAAKDTPRGATVQLNCTVGSSCQAALIGAPGEHDPFAGKSGGGLKLEAVSGGSCAVGTFQATGGSVTVDWPNGAKGAGGKCTASFTVRDAQNRTGEGVIELDAQGVPRPPAAISAVSYTSNSVTLRVTLSGEASHPATEGVRLRMDGAGHPASCSGSGASYDCVVSGLANGEKHSFTAVAFNSVGESEPTANAAPAWAYERPEQPRVDAKQVSAESPDTGTVRLDIAGKAGTSGFRIVTPAGTTTLSGQSGTARIASLPVGGAEISVVPLSAHEPPSGDSAEGSNWVDTVPVTGRPIVSITAGSSEQGSSQATVIVTVDSRGAPEARWGVSTGGGCSPSTSGDGGTKSVTGTAYHPLEVTACAENKWGAALTTASVVVNVGGTPPPPVVESGYTIRTTPTVSGSVASYDFAAGPTVSANAGHTLDFRVNGASVGGAFPATVTAGSAYSVAQCKNGVCSEAVSITGNAPGPVTVDLSGCIPSTATTAELRARISEHARSSGLPSFDHAAGTLTVNWMGPYENLGMLTASVCAEPDPEPPPGPESP
ncbi:Ig-like domain-containing protein [Leucobacter chironomi]|uniref:Ig-like domain-containing protein n=1 Tax=Leucobacter chironomi TaxID=491918 RepID=UPI00040155C0|nr:Ig-like domain-containing protein [Leucobacter chironomi]